MKKVEETLRDLLTGIIIYMVVIGIIGSFFVDTKFNFILGVVFGSAIAFLIAVHMYYTLDKALDLHPEQAVKYTKKKAFLRLIVMGLAVAVALTFPSVFHTVGVFMGVFSLKFSAYLQPLTNKYIFKNNYKGR